VIHAKNGGIVSTNNFNHAKADMDAIIASIKTAAVSEAAANSRRVVAQVRFNSPQAQMIRLQGQINEVRQMNRRAAFERMSQVDQMVAFMASMSVDFNTFRGL
jgi:inorganic pyrophosphatase/exopolyphosphatase